MKSISSRDNPLYKELKRLADNGVVRRQSRRSVLDGIHLAQAYLQHVGLPLQCVVSDSAIQHPEVAPLLARCQQGASSTCSCVLLTDVLFRSLSQVMHGVGLLFVIEVPAPIVPVRLTRSAVLLDRLQDPGNLGSILRSAAAAGIPDVYCGSGTAHAWSPKVLRAAMGAHFQLTIFEQVDLTALAAQATVPLLATSSHAPQSIHDADLAQPLAWLFGHEGQGVSSTLLQLASRQLAIPQRPGVESLNVAAAAAVCFFEQARQQYLASAAR